MVRESTAARRIDPRDDRPSAILHALLAALVLALAPLGLLLANTPFPGAAYDRIHYWHRSLGALALVVTLALIARRARRPRGAQVPGPARRRRLAATMHRLLLALLIVVALSKLARGAFGLGWSVFGLALAAPWPPNKDAARWLSTLHDYAAFALIALIALHSAAAVERWWAKREAALRRLR